MAVFAIGDLHLSLGAEKPMDIFHGWKDYVKRLEENWHKTICEHDTVVLAGDISWAMHLRDCAADFEFINNLPGHKYLIKGNHDYWWSTAKKMNEFFVQNNLSTLNILHNSCFVVNNTALCGTRGWTVESNENEANIINREIARLRESLQKAEKSGADEKIVFLHYPPISTIAKFCGIIDVMQEFGVKKCYYGHLHGASIKSAVQGIIDGIDYKLISADALAFSPQLIKK